ncbi:ABC transporter substrate-binding protein [Domibacillus iocasae]|uniref:Sugar ABC transporter substrate-binding protein n=1 Tax=Domibacillus iocasae TaxID=1714016 RepID=A0A1E7DK37_9BACI|nr:ABC transporter substrate-binding protein [Domibacillus iocasae]OES43436.1 sugar ABC transporter substrate-binding protein [Domibacillus iocasae]
MLNKKTLMLSSALLLSLAGCSTSNTDQKNSSNEAASGDQVTVNVYQGKVEFKTQFEELAAKYEEENPDVNIQVETVGGGSDYAGTLKAKFASGDEPTIYTIAGQVDIDQYRDRLMDLSDTEAAGLALEGTLDGVTRDEEVLGMPVNLEGYGLIYNKNVFKEAGVDAASIKTMDDLAKAAKKIDGKKEDLGLDAVFALAAKEKWVPGNHGSNVFLSPDFNNDPFAAYEAKKLPFGHGNEFKEYLDLQNQYSVQPVNNLDYSQQVEELFSTGRVAIIQQGNWIYPTVEGMDPELAESGMGIMPIPVNGETKMPVGVPSYYVVNKKAEEEQQQAAKDFIDWMYTSDEGKEAVLSEFKFIPAYEGYDAEGIADPLSKEIYQYSQDGNTSAWVFPNYPVGWSDQLGAEIQKYFAEETKWDEVVKNMQNEWAKARQ